MNNKNTIEFSTNWNNKLNNKAFTTIRIHNPHKYILGNSYIIELKGEKIGNAILKSKRTLTISQLNEFISYLDTGYNLSQTIAILQRMYPGVNLQTAKFDFCLLLYQQTIDNKTNINKQPPKQMFLPYKDV